MAFLPLKWLRALWGVRDEEPTIEPPPPAGQKIEHHPRPHRYHAGHEVDWGGVFDNPENVIPRTSSTSLLN